MISLDDFQQLTRRIEEIRRTRDRTAGAVEERKRKLLDEFNCKTTEEGRKILAKKQKKENELGEEYATEKAKFEKRWKDVLEKNT